MAKVALGVDVGLARVGVAISDPSGILATPVMTLRRDAKKNSDRRMLLRIITDRNVGEVFIGEPKSLAGNDTESTKMARDYAIALAELADSSNIELAVFLVDERLSTVNAHRALHASGRKMEDHRKVVDQVAATEILQQVLEMRRNNVRVQASRIVMK
ncbi:MULTISPECIES: Holliday junction resolvase RuvX [Glutamicibacter]|jgi:putative Holliday junction resolvase|uniref:Putative pre-16S rRNA nuclease n=1 Tax=Glutamicibacter halophytocola TaxID=1933880 RepID=A0A5B8ITT9_9MICC|nr:MULTISPECIES: Holliday junction resolvase RuvX [Glutamicibacter]ALG29079.1 Holliday junction resolvase [Glutamicibacter halophytocola]MBF6671791.1 Holliday junction resolvase RuvX [Glutamicibacter sp. FBE19]NQD39654.1 Holliday junction resolvase RuvX [Glutamicibacter halophytocola]QDY65340.1 Holliday junction resolvase RuvX [Glutamicibacter halophytocola]UUX60677.1 Holliday junction resolvase RuvX [Glutamicibacter halophytocola]